MCRLKAYAKAVVDGPVRALVRALVLAFKVTPATVLAIAAALGC